MYIQRRGSTESDFLYPGRYHLFQNINDLADIRVLYNGWSITVTELYGYQNKYASNTPMSHRVIIAGEKPSEEVFTH